VRDLPTASPIYNADRSFIDSYPFSLSSFVLLLVSSMVGKQQLPDSTSAW
jgi:hypothetical protein